MQAWSSSKSVRLADDSGSTSRGEEGTSANGELPAAALSRTIRNRLSFRSATEAAADLGLCSINVGSRCFGSS